MTDFELVVVGAGPGGSSAALYAAKAGIRTLLLDRSTFPRDKTCGDGLTPRAVFELAGMGLYETLSTQAHLVRQVRVVSPHGFDTRVTLPVEGKFPPHAWVIPRVILDAAILEKAVLAGAEFAAPVQAVGLEQAAGGVLVRTRTPAGERVLRAKMAILATGASMPLLKQAGFLNEIPAVIRAVRGYFEFERPIGERMEFRFDHVPLPGYGWLFPVEKGVVNIGLGYWPAGRRDRRTASVRRALDDFLHSPALRQEVGTLKQAGEIKSYPLRTDFATARTYQGRVMLVGESAGLVNPLTGEGIDYALESGRIAGTFLAEAGLSADLSQYDARLRKAFQPIFEFSGRVQRIGMRPFSLDLLTRWAERRADLKRLLTNLMLGTMAIPENISPLHVFRTLTGI